MEDAEFHIWLKNFLLQLSTDIDADVFSEYIQGLLEDDSIDTNYKLESVEDFLSSVIPFNKVKEITKTIVSNFFSKTDSHKSDFKPASTTPNDGLQTEDLETQMRSLLQNQIENTTPPARSSRECQPTKERDACTIEVLRAAGVSGYQGDKESEAAVAVALANAEFLAKQRLSSVNPSTVSNQRTSETFDNILSPEVETIDIEEVEDAAGYGKKEGIKPGSVMDALSILNPQQFGSSLHTPPPTDVQPTKVKRLPTPGDITSSTTPAYLLMTSKGPNLCRMNSPSTPATLGATLPNSSSSVPVVNLSPSNGGAPGIAIESSLSKKKKAAPPPKHMVDIGARAEEKHLKMVARTNEKLSNMPVAGRNRLDDMDAFFISDDEEDEEKAAFKLKKNNKASKNITDPLLTAGCGNHERVIKDELVKRQTSAKLHAEKVARDKADRAKQLEAEAHRKQKAKQSSEKQERRRR